MEPAFSTMRPAPLLASPYSTKTGKSSTSAHARDIQTLVIEAVKKNEEVLPAASIM
jgi:hypothetical protein